MSLRHVFPDVKLPELRREAEPVKAVPAMRKPSEINFRTGRDLSEIAQMMNGKHVVRVTAAVGAGKSTSLPRELVKATSSPLLHVVPSRLLAVAQYDWLSKLHTDMEYKLLIDGTEDISTTGITIASASAVWSKILQFGTDSKPLGSVVLFMDESHESDAYTYSLYKLAHVIPGVLGVVFASANHDPEKLPMRETYGDVESRKFSIKELPKTWDPNDLNKPWSMSSFNGSVLMFVEPNTVANNLVTSYNLAGATAYRLTSKMDVNLFRKAISDCANPGSGIVVLIADYSFRSGFTFDVSTIVDSALVSYQSVESSVQKTMYRRAYEIERYQAQGRGGRTPGSHCICYYPDVIPEASLCNLEQIEMDAAAILFRCAGYAVPSEIRSSKFSAGKIPKDLVYSFNDTNALVCQSDTLMCDLVYVSESKAQQNHNDELEGVINSYVDSPITPVSSLFGELSLKAEPEIRSRMTDAHGLLRELTSVASSTACVSPPGYYMVPGLLYDVVTTKLYGDDWVKCVDEIQRHPGIAKGFSSEQVREIIPMLLNAYNMLNASVIGTSFAANHKEDLLRAVASHPSQVKNWAEQVEEKIRVGTARLNSIADALNEIKPSSMHFVMVDSMKDMEDKVANKVAGQLISAIQATSRKLDAVSYQSNMMKRIDMPGFKPFAQEMLTMEQGDMQTAKATLVPCRIGNRSMWEIHISPNDSDRWDTRDFVDACVKLLNTANLSSRSVAKVVLPSYVSQSSVHKVFSQIHDAKYHRTQRQFAIR